MRATEAHAQMSADAQSKANPDTRVASSTVGDVMRFSPLQQDEAQTGNRTIVSLPDKKAVVYGPDGKVLRNTLCMSALRTRLPGR